MSLLSFEALLFALAKKKEKENVLRLPNPPTQINKRYEYVDIFMNKTNKFTLSIYT